MGLQALEAVVAGQAADAVELILAEGVDVAMARTNGAT